MKGLNKIESKKLTRKEKRIFADLLWANDNEISLNLISEEIKEDPEAHGYNSDELENFVFKFKIK